MIKNILIFYLALSSVLAIGVSHAAPLEQNVSQQVEFIEVSFDNNQLQDVPTENNSDLRWGIENLASGKLTSTRYRFALFRMNSVITLQLKVNQNKPRNFSNFLRPHNQAITSRHSPSEDSDLLS